MHLAGVSLALFLVCAAVAAPSRTNVEERGVDIDAVIPDVVPVNTRSGSSALISKLMTAPTQAERIRLLDQPGDFVFNFNANSTITGAETKGRGGVSIAATSDTMPALISQGASMTVGFLGPCGMNTAHVHNRATELNIIVQGRLVTSFIGENGARPVENTLSRFQMAVFPQGAIHQEFNPDCEDTVFVAGFNHQDPGVQTIAPNLFSLRPDVVSATLGGVQMLDGKDIESFREAIPQNIALGIDACLRKCGIKRNSRRSSSGVFAASL